MDPKEFDNKKGNNNTKSNLIVKELQDQLRRSIENCMLTGLDGKLKVDHKIWGNTEVSMHSGKH